MALISGKTHADRILCFIEMGSKNYDLTGQLMTILKENEKAVIRHNFDIKLGQWKLGSGSLCLTR